MPAAADGKFLYGIRLMLIRYLRFAVTVEFGAATLAGPERLPVTECVRRLTRPNSSLIDIKHN